MGQHAMSERQACRLLKISRAGYRYQAKTPDDSELREALLTLAVRKPRWGAKKMIDYFRNQGHSWNHKRIRRVYRELDLHLRVKPKKRLPSRDPQPLEVPVAANLS